MGFRAPYYATLEEALERGRPDAVWICTPPDSHAPLAEQCLRAGVATFIEKPLAQNVDDARRIEAAARSSGRATACGYAQIYFPSFGAALELLRAGAVGRINAVRSSMFLSQVFGPQKGWIADPKRSGGGVVANLSSHLLAQLRAAFGQPVRVRAHWKKTYGEVEDQLDAVMTLADGVDIEFDSTWSVPDYPISSTTIVVTGENGTLKITNDSVETDLREARAGRPAGRGVLRASELPARARFELNGEFYDLEDAEFLASVTGGPSSRASLELAGDVQRLMSALYESAARGGESVEVPK
jgi:predicted dehydrogenase